MPHIIVKLQAGRSDARKRAIAEAVRRAIVEADGCDDKWISIAVEDVDPADWTEAVYKPEIAARWDELYKKPDYEPD